MIFAAYFILRDRDMHIQLSAVIFSGRRDLLSDAITFYLRSFETQSSTQSSSLRQKKLISQVPEDAILKTIRPVYTLLFKPRAACRPKRRC